jgi:hypothetical protein
MGLASLIGGFVRRHWRSYASSAVMLFGVAVCTVLIPRKTGALIDGLAAHRLDQHDLVLGILELLGLGLAIYGCAWPGACACIRPPTASASNCAPVCTGAWRRKVRPSTSASAPAT